METQSWTPIGWRGGRDAIASIELIANLDAYCERGIVTKKGTAYKLADEPAKVTPRIRRDREDAEECIHNHRLIKDCWATPRAIWDLVEHLFGERIQTDPFWNPWATIEPVIRLTGHEDTGEDLEDHERGGFRLDRWKGPAGVNGPHSNVKRWIKLCAEYGEREKVAAIVGYAGDQWFQHHAAHANIICELGRVPFHAPPGLDESSPRSAYMACVWIPPSRHKKIGDVAKRVLSGESLRIPLRLETRHKIGTPKGSVVREVLVRPGVPRDAADTPKDKLRHTVDLFGVLG